MTDNRALYWWRTNLCKFKTCEFLVRPGQMFCSKHLGFKTTCLRRAPEEILNLLGRPNPVFKSERVRQLNADYPKNIGAL